MPEAPPLSPARKVGALWLLILLGFVVFNGVYWPARAYSRAHAPENFHARARALHEAGRIKEAIAILQGGVELFRPPMAAPYEDLARWLADTGAPDAAAALAPTVEFYRAMRGPVETRAAHLASAGRLATAQSPLVPAPDMERPVAMLAGVLGAAIGAGHAGLNLTYPEQLGLLSLAGGALRRDGQVGATGVRSPVNVLVQSGGGEGIRRQAHVVVGGRDWGGMQRGMHVVLIEPERGQVTGSSVFDVWRSATEAERLTRFLQDVLPGTIAAFAVYDDASAHVNPELEEAFRGFGLERRTLVGRAPALYGRRYSFAAIGVKGAAPGSALQAWSPSAYRVPGDSEQHDSHPVICGVLLPVGDGA